MTLHKIGPAMVGPELIGQPARALLPESGQLREGVVTGILIERGAFSAVSIAGLRCHLDEWEVSVDVPPGPADEPTVEVGGVTMPQSHYYAATSRDDGSPVNAEPPRRRSIDFKPRYDETPLESINRHAGETAGAISMCWDPTPTGTFEADAAGEYLDEFTEFIARTLALFR